GYRCGRPIFAYRILRPWNGYRARSTGRRRGRCPAVAAAARDDVERPTHRWGTEGLLRTPTPRDARISHRDTVFRCARGDRQAVSSLRALRTSGIPRAF